ncbi:TRAP transporter small permease subunit [Cohaesibacter sp. CAU 1516]|uniref:TRAP transporter small permease n=1 Tax=Cohaesibacter sp. CAU 1516 TaxID=2576038 RepID=UPI0010FE222C|nr:TRAP transporter small permease subunit [Cohaesibacter sp. CAU 1516]TLP44176.1 TRAP transporter small permease subunit [Cohaesibacter sp. CAU 1516]
MRDLAAKVSLQLNQVVEMVVAILMVALVLDVWLGVVDRYFFHWQLPWPEVLARYLMIWSAMLAVSSGIARREHIGLTAFIAKLPASMRHICLILIDLLALALFVYLFWYGLDFAQGGSSRVAMIFGASLLPFYAAIPVASLLCVLQLCLVLIRDLGSHLDEALPSSDEVAS